MNPIFWLILILIFWLVVYPRLIKKVNSGNDLPRAFNKLVKAVKTEENEGQIEALIKYHNQRIEAGADGQESLDRLIRDLRRLGGLEEKDII